MERVKHNDRQLVQELGEEMKQQEFLSKIAWMSPRLPKETSATERKQTMFLNNFCSQTSLHGWPYLESEAGFFRKGLWLVVIAASIVVSIYFTSANVMEFIHATTVISINSTTAPLR